MKKLIIISGLPGSGKSTVAEGVAERLSLPVFSVDPIESSIIKAGIEKSFETGYAAYLVAETLAAEQLHLGTSVVIDAVSGVKPAREMWRNLSKEHSAKLVIIECFLDEELHKQRLAARVRNLYGFDEITWDDVQKRKKEYLPWEEERLVLDTSGSPESNVQEALEYINSRYI